MGALVAPGDGMLRNVTRRQAVDGNPRLAVGFLVLLAGLVGLPAVGAADEVAEAEALVRLVYYEGLPYADAAAVSPAGAARLAEMLADPAEAAHHANIVFALGVSAHAGAFESLAAFADAAEGEVSRDTFRALRSVPFAMGHLSRQDPRALAWLSGRVHRKGAPDWQCGRHRGDRIARLQRRLALAGLGLSDRPEAAEILQRASDGPEADIVRDAVATRGRLLRDGAGATFDREAQ